MLYLATQYAGFLLAAFAMGGLMGWISCAGRLQLSAGPLPYLLAAWLLVLAATGLQALNGEAALWIETALLYVAAYLLGCSVASFLRAALPRRTPEPAAAVAEAPAVTPEALATRAEAPVAKQDAPAATASSSGIDASRAATTAAEPAPPVEDVKPAAKPARRKRSKSPKQEEA